MDRPDAGGGHGLLLPPAAVDAVGHEGAVLPEAVLVVALPVLGAVGVEFLHPGDLAGVLREMGLDRKVPLRRQLPEGLHETVGAGRSEPGGQDGPDVGEAAVFQPPEGLGEGLRRLLLRGSGVAVHVHLANVPRDPGFLQLLHEDERGIGVPGGEGGYPGGAGGDEVPGQPAVYPAGVVQILEPGLRAEGVGVQPVQQGQVHAHAQHGVLGGVEMQVREGGHDEGVAVVRHRAGGVLLRQDGAYRLEDAVLQNEVAVGDGLQRAEGGGVDDVAV